MPMHGVPTARSSGCASWRDLGTVRIRAPFGRIVWRESSPGLAQGLTRALGLGRLAKFLAKAKSNNPAGLGRGRRPGRTGAEERLLDTSDLRRPAPPRQAFCAWRAHSRLVVPLPGGCPGDTICVLSQAGCRGLIPEGEAGIPCGFAAGQCQSMPREHGCHMGNRRVASCVVR